MTSIWQWITLVAILIGTLFSVLGVLGFIRLPDIYARLHASGKVGVFGVVFLLVGAIMWTPLGWGKGLLLIILLILTGPTVAHAIGSAAYRTAQPLGAVVQDDLAEAAVGMQSSLTQSEREARIGDSGLDEGSEASPQG